MPRKAGIHADITGSAKGLGKAADDAEKAAERVERRWGRVGDTIDRATGGRLAKASDGLSKAFSSTVGDGADGALAKFSEFSRSVTDRLGPAGATAQTAIDGITAKLGRVPAPAMAAAGALTAFAGASAALGVHAVNRFTELAASSQQLSRALGITTEEASKLAGAASMVGADTGDVTELMNQFADVVANRSEDLTRWGIEITRSADGTVDLQRTLLSLADAYAATNDATIRATIGNAAFGEQFVQIAPLLERGSGGIRELMDDVERRGGVLTDEDAAKAREFKTAMGELHQTSDAYLLQVARPLVGELGEFTRNVVAANDAVRDLTGNADLFGAWGSTIAAPFAVFNDVASTFKGDAADMSDELRDQAMAARHNADQVAGAAKQTVDLRAAAEAAAAAESALAARLQLASQSAQEQQARFAALASATTGSATSSLQGARNADRFAGALDNLRSSSTSAGGAVASNARQVESASRSLADAQDRLAEAQQGVNEAMEEQARQMGRAQRDASEQLEDLDRRLADSAENRARQERDLAEQREDITRAANGRLVDIEERLQETLARRGITRRERTDAIADAAKETAEIEQQLGADLVEFDTEAAERRGDAARGLADEERDAARTRRDVAERLAESQRSADERIAGSHRSVAQAARSVADAERSLAEAHESASARSAVASETAAQAARRKRAALDEATDAALDDIEAMIQQGATAPEIAAKIAGYETQIRNAATAAGVDRTAIDRRTAALDRMNDEMERTILLQQPIRTAQLIQQGIRPDAASWQAQAEAQAALGYQFPMALGGPVAAGGVYRVGERGAETVVMGGDGTVIPNGAGTASSVVNVTINMPKGADGEDVVAAIRRYEKRNGRGWRT
ncbi:MAG: hypothetical protein ACKVWR_00180 [Acidimicrobiales bacterium]